jgi:hypothetical protein
MPTASGQPADNNKPKRPSELPAAHFIEPDAAVYCGVSTSYLRKARRFGRGPAFVRHGRAIRYALADLQEWAASHRVSHSG